MGYNSKEKCAFIIQEHNDVVVEYKLKLSPDYFRVFVPLNQHAEEGLQYRME